MNPPSEDIKDYLELSDTGLDWVFSTTMFIGYMPETPDNCISIHDTGGFAPQPNYIYEKPTVQIRVRGPKQDYQSGWDDIKGVFDALHGVHSQVINGTTYIQILALSDILFIGFDKNKRPVFTANFAIHRTE